MRIIISAFGFGACFEFGREGDDSEIELSREDVEQMVDQIQTVRGKISGGQSLEADRDLNPLIPGTEKDYDSWADRPFGFGR
jgi:hypothetical protein